MQAWQWGFTTAIVGYPVFYNLSAHFTPRIPHCGECYSRFSKGGRADWDSRLPSNVQAVIAVLGTYYPSLLSTVFLEDRVNHWDPRLWVPYGVTGLGPTWFMGLFVGYLLADLVVVVKHWKEVDMPAVNTIHHVLAVCSWSLSLHLHTMQWYACIWLMAELSTPLANLRWYLVRAGLRTNSNLYLFVGSWLFSTFFVVRILPIPFMIWLFWQYDSVDAFHSGGPVALTWWSSMLLCNCALQWYWWSKMLQAIIRKLGCCGAPEELRRGE